jgi:predicted short-subunit dehydrogenase-like oxidoreductase (DUF2520 family)
MFNPAIAIIGAGKAGTALGCALAERGLRICGVASRSLDSAHRLADRFGAAASTELPQVTPAAEVIFIATPDGAVADTAGKIAAAGGFKPGQFVYHLSGALGPDALASARECKAFAGCMHPLQTLAGTQADKEYLKNCYYALDGDEKAYDMAERLVELLGGTGFYISAEKRALYHAAASTASNYLVALLHAAASMLNGAGLSLEDSIRVLMPLVEGTLKNISGQGTVAALTGPISRGDTQTVVRHMGALRDTKEADLYAALARYTASIALQKGTLSSKQAHEILAQINKEER